MQIRCLSLKREAPNFCKPLARGNMIALRCICAQCLLSAAFVALQSQYLSLAPATASMSPGLLSTMNFATPQQPLLLEFLLCF
jgi:hypothetical protein